MVTPSPDIQRMLCGAGPSVGCCLGPVLDRSDTADDQSVGDAPEPDRDRPLVVDTGSPAQHPSVLHAVVGAGEDFLDHPEDLLVGELTDLARPHVGRYGYGDVVG